MKLIVLLLLHSALAQSATFECMDLANSLALKKYVSAINTNANNCYEKYEAEMKPIIANCDSKFFCSDELLRKQDLYLKEKVKICEGIKKKYQNTDLLTVPPEALIFEGIKPKSIDDVFQLNASNDEERQELIFLKSFLPRLATDEIDINRFCQNYVIFSARFNKTKKARADALEAILRKRKK